MTGRSESSRGLLGAVLAGGASSRFGSPKWSAELAGESMGARAVNALAPNCERVVAVGDDPAAAALGVEVRPDLSRGSGPLAGIATALSWAEELGLAGAFVLACDLPLVSADLVSRLIGGWTDEDAVAPLGPRGFEPLCALYSVTLLPRVQMLMARVELSPNRLLAAARVRSFPVDDARGAGGVRDPFMNVNTREDHARAEAELARRGPDSG